MFLDVGAHIGRYAVLASNKFKKVYAIEPQKSNFNILGKNIKMNKVTNIQPVNCAVSNKSGIAYLSGLEMNTGTVRLSKCGNQKTEVFTLNYLLSEYLLEPEEIDFILIDVESHEKQVLEGASEILEKGKPTIILESFNVKSVDVLLKKYGYHRIDTLDFYNHVFVKS